MKAYIFLGFFLAFFCDSRAQTVTGLPIDLRTKWMNPALNALNDAESLSLAFSGPLSNDSIIQAFFLLELGKLRKNGMHHGLYYATDGAGQHTFNYRFNFMQRDCLPHSRNYRSVGLSIETYSTLTNEGSQIFLPDINFGVSKRRRQFSYGISTTNLTSLIFQPKNRFATMNFHTSAESLINRKLSFYASGILGINTDHLSARLDIQLKGRRDRFATGIFIESSKVIGVEYKKAFRWSKDSYANVFALQIGSSVAYDYARHLFFGTIQLTIPFFSFKSLLERSSD